MNDVSDSQGSSGKFDNSGRIRILIHGENRARDWERFVFLYTPLIDYWIRMRGIREHDVENLRQDVFARLLTALEDFSSRKGHFRAWLRTICNNKVTDWMRKRNPMADGGSDAWKAMEGVPSEVPSPDSMLDSLSSNHSGEDAILYRQIMTWVDKNVQSRHAEIFRMLVMEGKDPADVAEKFQMSVGNIYVIKSKLLKKIREAFDGML